MCVLTVVVGGRGVVARLVVAPVVQAVGPADGVVEAGRVTGAVVPGGGRGAARARLQAAAGRLVPARGRARRLAAHVHHVVENFRAGRYAAADERRWRRR